MCISFKLHHGLVKSESSFIKTRNIIYRITELKATLEQISPSGHEYFRAIG